jgi:hypothetical protein
MQIFIYCIITLHVSGVHHTPHQEYTKLYLQPTVQQRPSSNVAKFGHAVGRLLLRYCDLYRRLQLQFYVLLMMGAMDTRNMQSDFEVNKYLHTVASY